MKRDTFTVNLCLVASHQKETICLVNYNFTGGSSSKVFISDIFVLVGCGLIAGILYFETLLSLTTSVSSSHLKKPFLKDIGVLVQNFIDFHQLTHIFESSMVELDWFYSYLLMPFNQINRRASNSQQTLIRVYLVY